VITIIGLDGLEYTLVRDFDLRNLQQLEYGKTSLDLVKKYTSYPDTIGCWSTFLSGKVAYVCQSREETIFSLVDSFVEIGVPGYMRELEPEHRRLTKKLVEVLEGRLSEERYEGMVRAHTESVLEKTLKAMLEKPGLLMTYFPIADLLGHLYFRNPEKIQETYEYIDGVVRRLVEGLPGATILIVSDHGMEPWFGKKRGEHTWYGFYSVNKRLGLNNPGIEGFYNVIRDEVDRQRIVKRLKMLGYE